MQVNLDAAEVNFKKFAASGVAASVIFTGERFEIKDARLHHANGEITVSSKIEELQNNYHPVRVNMRLSNVDVKKCFMHLTILVKIKSLLLNLNGIMNTSIAVNLDINNKAVVRKNSIRGNVDFSIKNGALINFKPLQNINKVVFLRKEIFSNIRFAEIKKTNLKFLIALCKINRMEISSSVFARFCGRHL